MKLRLVAQLVIPLVAAAFMSIACQADDNESSATVRLGGQLFYDSQLSYKGDVSCASCHQPARTFSDGRSVGIGTAHQSGTRNVPSLLNFEEGPFFWDGRATRLEDVVTQPFTNPVEMGLADESELLVRIRRDSTYRRAFDAAFPDTADPITVSRVRQALAAYLRSQLPGTSAYNSDTLSLQARHGLALFQGSAGCAECHRLDKPRASLTDHGFHSTLINPALAQSLPQAAIRLAAENPDSGTLSAEIESDIRVSELGRYVVTHDPKDIGSFRTPSLRNVALTAPYMHDGSVATLREAVDREIYYRNLQGNRPNTLTEQDRQDLVAFLRSLGTGIGKPGSKPKP